MHSVAAVFIEIGKGRPTTGLSRRGRDRETHVRILVADVTRGSICLGLPSLPLPTLRQIQLLHDWSQVAALVGDGVDVAHALLGAAHHARKMIVLALLMTLKHGTGGCKAFHDNVFGHGGGRGRIVRRTGQEEIGGVPEKKLIDTTLQNPS